MPDANPMYKKMPRPESFKAFEKYVNSKVISMEKVDEQIYELKRIGKSTIKVYLTNIYTVSETDVYEILQEYPDLDCIVTMSAWNSYTSSAKEVCKDKKIGLFLFREFLGAIYYDGKKFLDYIPPKKR